MKWTVRRKKPLWFSGAFTHKLCRHSPSAVSAFGFITAVFCPSPSFFPPLSILFCLSFVGLYTLGLFRRLESNLSVHA